MKKLLLAIVLSTAVSCAAVMPYLPTVLMYVQDGLMILDKLEDFSETFFASHPNAEREKQIKIAIARAKTSLDLALRAAQGVDKASKAEIDAMFAEFKLAYLDVVALMGPLGVRMQGRQALASSPDGTTMVVPEPLAFGAK